MKRLGLAFIVIPIFAAAPLGESKDVSFNAADGFA